MANWLTLQFGPWAPDLQNTPIPVAPNESETQIPCADVLNVYYQDGAYRCLPSLSPVAPSIGQQCVSAFTYYDNVAAQDVVFVATANGIVSLIDGIATAVPFENIVSVTGSGLSLRTSLSGTLTGTGLVATTTLGSGTITVVQPLQASASPVTAAGSCSSATNCTAFATTTVTASGGTGNYTYAWSYVSGAAFSLTGATTATPQWAQNQVTNNQTAQGQYKCVVSDGVSQVTVNVTVDLTFNKTGAQLSASAPSPANGACVGVPSCTASASSTVTASGGSGSYTYAWSYVSGSSFTLTGATTATATWTLTHNTASDPTLVGNYKCVVSDGTNQVTVTVQVDLNFSPS